MPGGDASGQLQREGGELGVVLRRDDLGVILAGVEERAARGSVALVAYRNDLGLIGFLRSVLAQGLERVGHLEDVKLQLVGRVAGGVIEGVGHALDPVLEEALGAAVDLLVEVVGVEGFDVLGSRLAGSPARWQVAQRKHGGDGLLRLGHCGDLGLDLGGRQAIASSGRGNWGGNRGRQRRSHHCDGGRGGRGNARNGVFQRGRRGGEVAELLRAVHAHALADTGQRLQNARKRLGHRGRGSGHRSEGEHGLIQLLDVVHEVLPLQRQPLHLALDGNVSLLHAGEPAALIEHRPGLVGVELVAVPVEVSALDHQAPRRWPGSP